MEVEEQHQEEEQERAGSPRATICGAFNSHLEVCSNRCAREEERRRESVDEYCTRNARKLERSGRRTDRLAEVRRERHRQRPRYEHEKDREMFFPHACVFHSTENRRKGVLTPRHVQRQVTNAQPIRSETAPRSAVRLPTKD